MPQAPGRLIQLVGALGLMVVTGCVPMAGRHKGGGPPTLVSAPAAVRPSTIALPFHSAAIVDVAMLPPIGAQRWRMASGDADGWVRIWADGRLLAAELAHPGGLSVLKITADGVLYTAGFDGRLIEWRDGDRPGVPTPTRAWALERPVDPEQPGPPRRVPITAVAMDETTIAISGGLHIQEFTRQDTPELEWGRPAANFVTGMTLSKGGGTLAVAELRSWALVDGLANHPQAPFSSAAARALTPLEQAERRTQAERERPGAHADFIEVWQPNRRRHRELHLREPIDSDLGLLPRGVVVYREVWDRQQAWVVAQRLEDLGHESVPLVKPWPFITPAELEAEGVGNPVGDFVIGDGGEIIVVDRMVGWDREPPAGGWWVGEGREMTIGFGHAALGDGQGNLAVVRIDERERKGWRAPGEERPELVTATTGASRMATATLEPRARYRLFDLAMGTHRLLRVEAVDESLPPAAVPPAAGDESVARGVPRAMFPAALAMDDGGHILATSLSSFSDAGYAAIRTLAIDPVAEPSVLLDRAAPLGFALGLAPDGLDLVAWSPGDHAFHWAPPTWQPNTEWPRGRPLFSANGEWVASVAASERRIWRRGTSHAEPSRIDSQSADTVDPTGEVVAALAGDGTLAVIQPFGGGELEWIPADRERAIVRVELPGAGTAMAWVPTGDGEVLVVGFEDGSIGRVDLDPTGAEQPTNPVTILDGGRGGRVWSLSAIGVGPTHAASPTSPASSPSSVGAFVELDDAGITLHRLSDSATLELHIADPTALARHAGSPPEPGRADGLVAIWRRGAGMSVCRVLDGTGHTGGVLLTDATIERWGPDRAGELFAAFLAGQGCGADPLVGDPAP